MYEPAQHSHRIHAICSVEVSRVSSERELLIDATQVFLIFLSITLANSYARMYACIHRQEGKLQLGGPGG